MVQGRQLFLKVWGVLAKIGVIVFLGWSESMPAEFVVT